MRPNMYNRYPQRGANSFRNVSGSHNIYDCPDKFAAVNTNYDLYSWIGDTVRIVDEVDPALFHNKWVVNDIYLLSARILGVIVDEPMCKLRSGHCPEGILVPARFLVKLEE